MSAFMVRLDGPDVLESGARVDVMQTDATRRRSRPMSAFRVPLDRPDEVENGARVDVMQPGAGVVR